MKPPIVTGSVLLFASVSAPTFLVAQQNAAAHSVDKIMALGSVVGGETPQWSPDGSRILFASSLAAGGLLTVPADGGFPVRVPATLGAAGHFLASQSPRYSPDGAWLSYVSDKGGSPEIWIWSWWDGQDLQLTDIGGVGINGYSWSPDGRWIAFAANRYGSYDVWKVAVPSGEVHRLTDGEQYEVYPSWTPDSRNILYVKLDDRWVDHDVIEITADGRNPRIVVRDEDFFDYRAGSAFGFADVSSDGNTVLFRSHRSSWINYWTVPLSGGDPRPIAPEAADQSNAAWSPDGRYILFTSNHNGTHSLKVVPAAGGQPRTIVDPEVGVVDKPAWSPDGRLISYTFGTPTRPADLYVIPAQGGTARQLTHSIPDGNLEASLAVPEKVSYHSTNGFTISAYLYRPQISRDGGRAPAIIWAHGGPASQYHDTFQPQVQFFVERGYVALLPNFRGSSGYGKEFEDANYQCWGHCDLEDILAGVDYLKALPYVDADNLGITGNSYGGFMTCAAVAFAPGVFQAAVGLSGYCNRVTFIEEGEYQHLQQLEYNFGPFDENRAFYERSSPFYAIKNIRTPTFLIHGEGRFPESNQYREFADEMERHYKTFRYKAYPNENYYVRSRENQRQMFLDMLDFFDQYLTSDEEQPELGTQTEGRR